MYHTNIQYKSLYVRGRMTHGPIPADYDALHLNTTSADTINEFNILVLYKLLLRRCNNSDNKTISYL